jgi:hypothetical protein
MKLTRKCGGDGDDDEDVGNVNREEGEGGAGWCTKIASLDEKGRDGAVTRYLATSASGRAGKIWVFRRSRMPATDHESDGVTVQTIIQSLESIKSNNTNHAQKTTPHGTLPLHLLIINPLTCLHMPDTRTARGRLTFLKGSNEAMIR